MEWNEDKSVPRLLIAFLFLCCLDIFGMKKHSFMFNDENGFRQILFTRNIPSSPISKLTTFKSGAKDYFVLRNANNINFF